MEGNSIAGENTFHFSSVFKHCRTEKNWQELIIIMQRSDTMGFDGCLLILLGKQDFMHRQHHCSSITGTQAGDTVVLLSLPLG